MILVKPRIAILFITAMLALAGCKPEKHHSTPTVRNAENIYANANAGMFAPAVRSALPRVYVPNIVLQINILVLSISLAIHLETFIA